MNCIRFQTACPDDIVGSGRFKNMAIGDDFSFNFK
jgi:hypothetical protein